MQVEEPIQTEGSKSSKEDHQHSSADLLEKAQKAALDGRTIFYKEGEGIPVKEGGTLFFNAASSKLSGRFPKATIFNVARAAFVKGVNN